MPKTSDMMPSTYLKRGDVGVGVLWTIRGIQEENVGGDETDPQMKWVLYFKEAQKGLVLNKTNITRIEQVTGSDDTDNWMGKQIVIYWDPTIEFMGEIKGGLRVRAPKSKEEQELPF